MVICVKVSSALKFHEGAALQGSVVVNNSNLSSDMLPEKDFGKSLSPLLECYLSRSLKVSEFYST